MENNLAIIDDKDSISLEGIWGEQFETNAHNGSFQWARGTDTACPAAEYHFMPEKTGNYKLSVYIPDMLLSFGMADSVIYEISINHLIADTILVDQKSNRGKWYYLDSIDLLSDVEVSVRIMNGAVKGCTKQLVIDAVRFELADIVDTEAPDLNVIDTICTEGYVKATSSETGWIYLVPEGTEKDLTTIERVCLDSIISVSKAIVNIPITVEMEGTFWLYARDIHGNLSDPVSVVIAGIDKQVVEKINIYPNPVVDILTIQCDLSGEYTLEITSLNGLVIYTKQISGQLHRIDFSNFQNGVYFISIKSKDLITTKKIIKLVD
jgi:hypothetical protein